MPRKPARQPKEKVDGNKKTSLFSPEVNAAIIGALVILLGYVLVNFGVADAFMRRFKTHSKMIIAQPHDTGSAYSLDGAFHSFQDGDSNIAVGEVAIDSNSSIQEVESRFFMTFYLTDIPKNVEVDSVQLEIPCRLQGDISKFSTLRLKAIDAESYDARYFDAYTSDIWSKLYFSVGWKPEQTQDMVTNLCEQGKPIVVLTNNGLINAVGNTLSSSFLQFVFWFDGRPSLPNGHTDAILITEPPTISITYVNK